MPDHINALWTEMSSDEMWRAEAGIVKMLGGGCSLINDHGSETVGVIFRFPHTFGSGKENSCSCLVNGPEIYFPHQMCPENHVI